MNSYMPTNYTTYKKWVNFQKHKLPRLNQKKYRESEQTNNEAKKLNK